jgi:uncharacterized membrane protein
VRANLSKKDIEGILEATADALSDTLPKLRRYFKRSEFSQIGERMAAAWEEGIKETLQGAAHESGKKSKQGDAKRGPSASEAAIIASLRKKGGQLTGPQRALAEELQMPLSTLSAALRRLEQRKMLRREKKTVELI